MSVLGINIDGVVFEGRSEHGAHFVWPQPVMTLARFAEESDKALVPANENEAFHCYFREDFFDPVSRVRRGRFYQWEGRTSDWQVLPSGNISIAGTHSISQLIGVSMRGYRQYRPSMANKDKLDLVVLGSAAAFSIWSVVGIETISTGDELVTLRARQSLGALPDVHWDKVPADHRHKVREEIGKLADDYRRAVPESVVDRAREAAAAILSAYLQSKGDDSANGKDLAELVKKLTGQAGPNEQRIVACAAEIPQRLHSRCKNSEREKRDNLRPIREQDAEMVVQCIGVMLCDLRWADWK